ncbi:hypothetical protein BUALT_Bualt05G0066000 [Buddleja alternifolia]|uniref:Uncharacterized protein n=1 Tax=Buddleja alternifolia TaxID=168488 RepID=A0AAV6XT87_9LAMI|nr:hypothetical protein BUALT_Bualt05G0066000 [Buddleja alternifolia]
MDLPPPHPTKKLQESVIVSNSRVLHGSDSHLGVKGETLLPYTTALHQIRPPQSRIGGRRSHLTSRSLRPSSHVFRPLLTVRRHPPSSPQIALNHLSSRSDSELQIYIVHVELPSAPSLTSFVDDLQGWYQTFLPSTLSISSTSDEPRIIYSYRNVFKGFAARLSLEEAKAMETKPGFVLARPQTTIPLHTTHSPNFLGLNQNMGFWRDSNYGRAVIIGVLDTGINPNHPSFNDEGMPPPPARWNGICQFNSSTACNNKLIGARYFRIGNGTPFDEDGHGTHTASTAAGNFVRGANVFGNANGTAAGIAPLAHVAMYKVCTSTGCLESDILAGMEAAIDDGIDVLSLSLGGPPRTFYNQNIAIGAFSAIERGIFVSASAGNDGPTPGSVGNGAPWLLTVGASTTDRKIRSTVVLGNDEQFDGESTFQPSSFSSTLLPIVYPGGLPNNSGARFCEPVWLRNTNLTGRMVLRDEGGIGRIAKGRAMRNAGGTAMILVNLPSQGGTIIGDNPAPTVASFSARGLNRESLGILKPDIIGPGHNILAAWHVSVENNINTNSNFNIISRTSMSCPHLSGVAALLKNAHPDWSPAAIKSAIMTTADQVNLAGNPIEDETQSPADSLAVGSGHVNILRATDPALVYDTHPEDYLPYLCGLNYTDQQVGIIVSRVVRCAEIASISQTELNYPSFVVFLGSGNSRTYNRTVTNVGDANSVYSVGIGALPGVDMRVEPSTLRFSALNQTLTYQVTFERLANTTSNTVVQGSLTWTSGRIEGGKPGHYRGNGRGYNANQVSVQSNVYDHRDTSRTQDAVASSTNPSQTAPQMQQAPALTSLEYQQLMHLLNSSGLKSPLPNTNSSETHYANTSQSGTIDGFVTFMANTSNTERVIDSTANQHIDMLDTSLQKKQAFPMEAKS